MWQIDIFTFQLKRMYPVYLVGIVDDHSRYVVGWGLFRQQNADAVFDTSLVYEPSVLRVFAERYLLEVPRDDPASTTAQRLLKLLDRYVTIYPDHVPSTSILREFIGGSGFEM